MKTRVGIVSLGCAKNLVDSEAILGMFSRDDYEITSDPSKSDLIIINTCGFIESAKRESIETIIEMSRYKKAKIVVTGCFVTRNLEELKASLPEVALWVPIKDYPLLHEEIKSLLKNEGKISPFDLSRRTLSGLPWSAYLKISDGCDNHCAFCAIPLIKGAMTSRKMEDILLEAKELLKKGVKEISLVSQDPLHYGFDFPSHTPNMLTLLKALDELPFESIRLLYLYPEEISDDILYFIRDSKHIEPYFDIPIQTASDPLLKKMNRHGNVEEMKELFRKINDIFPKKALRTTLIAGFPEENEKMHKETLSFLKEFPFDHLGVFIYSKEEGTAAFYRQKQVPFKTKDRRRKEIMELARTESYRLNKERIGEIMEGFVLSYNAKDNLYTLRSYWNAPDDIDGKIYFRSNKTHQSGERVKVKITSAFIYDLMGEEVL